MGICVRLSVFDEIYTNTNTPMKTHDLSPLARLVGAVIAIASITSCTTQIPQSFWQEKNTRVAVAVAIPDSHAAYYRAGDARLSDMVITRTLSSGPENAISKVKPDSFRKVKGEFVAALKKKGLNAVEVEEDLRLEDYPQLTSRSGDSGKDFSSLLTALQADYLIVLKLDSYGSIRNYYGHVTNTDPSGYAKTSGFMVKKGTSKPIWDTAGSSPTLVQVVGSWDQAPDFRNLVDASNRAIETSRSGLTSQFFN
jgi:hypothetical protein